MASGRMVREGVCVFLLIVLATLHHTVKAEVRILDMAPDAVDDDFSKCGQEMLQAVTDNLLQEELTADKKFKYLWTKHHGECKKNFSGGTSHHITALQAYGNSQNSFRKKFNDLVYRKGSNSTTYREEFHFKSLHFLLTDSLRLLKPANIGKTVFSATRNKYTTDTGAKVRFGKFLKAEVSQSSAVESAEVEDEGTLFIITSRSVVKVEDFTCKCEELQCLISPAEVFQVQKVRNVSIEGYKFKEINLTHSHFLNNHHCSFFDRNAAGVESSISLSLTLLTLAVCLLNAVTVTA